MHIHFTVNLHKRLNSSKGVIRSRDLRYCSEEELSGVTHARRLKVRWGEGKIQINIVVLTFDSPKPPNRPLPRGQLLHTSMLCWSLSGWQNNARPSMTYSKERAERMKMA
ncbi:Gag-like protein [Plakobranchus ocellatus]|uniref:Gag-like protein n=1 Tax=Plakobranchus ocellatus TaxID=259542 RepID=A0AAV4A213_9GAST|nr:Gag-like protein [Plakobranchus ocellatus]